MKPKLCPKTSADVEALFLDIGDIGSWKVEMANVAIVKLTARTYALGVVDQSRRNWLKYGNDGQPPARDFIRVRILTKSMDYTQAHIALGILQSDYGYAMGRLEPAGHIQRERTVQE